MTGDREMQLRDLGARMMEVLLSDDVIKPTSTEVMAILSHLAGFAFAISLAEDVRDKRSLMTIILKNIDVGFREEQGERMN